jgi:hypothetical protein
MVTSQMTLIIYHIIPTFKHTGHVQDEKV